MPPSFDRKDPAIRVFSRSHAPAWERRVRTLRVLTPARRRRASKPGVPTGDRGNETKSIGRFIVTEAQGVLVAVDEQGIPAPIRRSPE